MYRQSTILHEIMYSLPTNVSKTCFSPQTISSHRNAESVHLGGPGNIAKEVVIHSGATYQRRLKLDQIIFFFKALTKVWVC